MKKKKTVAKKVTPKKTKKLGRPKKSIGVEPAETYIPKLEAGSFQDTVLEALNHVLAIAKAALYDAFRQYIEGKICQGLPATLEEFVELFKMSLYTHGIDDDKLVASLDDRGRKYLMDSAKLLEAGTGIKAPATPAITKTKAQTQVQSEQASKIDPNEFNFDGPKTEPALKVVDAKSQQVSVFSDLDVL